MEFSFLNFFVIFISGLFHGFLGFGFPMILTPIFSLMHTMSFAIIASVIPTITVNSATIFSLRSQAKVLVKFMALILPVILGSYIGTQILLFYPTNLYKILLSLIIFLYLFSKKVNISLEFLKNESGILKFSVGLISGIVSGLVNVMVPVLIIYVKEIKLSRFEKIALMNACFISSKLTQTTTFLMLGKLDYAFLLWSLLAALIAILGLLLGQHYAKKINAKIYEKLLNLSLIIMAFMLLFQGISFKF